MTWTLFGRETTNPLAIAVVCVLCLLMLPPTLIPHLVLWVFNGDGLIKRQGLKYMYEPGVFWTIVSNVVFYGLHLLVIL